MALASSILPDARRDWGQAMRAELDYAKSDAAALGWACGCLVASLKERVNTMLSSNGQISRWVLMLEWLVCFAPLTLTWVAAVSHVASHDDIPGAVLIATILGTLGPLALATAMLATFARLQRGLRPLAQMLAVGFAVVAALQLVAVLADGRVHATWFEFDGSVAVLLVLLPLVGSLHLVHILGSSRPNVPAA